MLIEVRLSKKAFLTIKEIFYDLQAYTIRKSVVLRIVNMGVYLVHFPSLFFNIDICVRFLNDFLRLRRFFDNGSDIAKMIIIVVSRVGECVHHRNRAPLIMSCSVITTLCESRKIFRNIKSKVRSIL